jgi:hypothetical protein
MVFGEWQMNSEMDSGSGVASEAKGSFSPPKKKRSGERAWISMGWKRRDLSRCEWVGIGGLDGAWSPVGVVVG